MTSLAGIITAAGGPLRDTPLESACAAAPLQWLLNEAAALDRLRKESPNLYQRVRALFFLSALHRYHLPATPGVAAEGRIPFTGYSHLLDRRFEEAIRSFLHAQSQQGPNRATSSALALAYRGLAFQTLADQVRLSVRGVRGNQWMFRTGHPSDAPLRLRPELLQRDPASGLFPVLRETTPVRMDLSHSGWSDIFFLGMDFPEGARVLNVSIDLAVRDGRFSQPRPPVEAWLRVIDTPVLRLASTDLKASAEITTLHEVFDYARDYLGLLKAAVIAGGLVPPGLEGSGESLADLLAQLAGSPGLGIEIVSKVNDIPKGSRLAVSTNLLACLITAVMRATGQVRALTGGLEEPDRRLVAARAILGEWLGGSGGGWQDSGGVWPGIKLIQGVLAAEGDVEHGISRGCLLPRHTVFPLHRVSAETRLKLQHSLVLVHGGMAQDVGPILEMVTEKYLLRSGREWEGRKQAISILDQIVACLEQGDIRSIGRLTHSNFDGPIQTIIPWAGNYYTQLLIDQVRAGFGESFWGFWMLGGMAGGGMGFLFDPAFKPAAQERLAALMLDAKRRLEASIPFAMDPVVYDFSINERGTWADLHTGGAALLPAAYYQLRVPELVRRETRSLTPTQRAELDHFGEACRHQPELSGMVQVLFDRLLPHDESRGGKGAVRLQDLLESNGFDRIQHEHIRSELRSGRVGLSQNRLPASSTIEDVRASEIADSRGGFSSLESAGRDALAFGSLAILTLAGGAGSRWTRGSGVVKALNPFARFSGRHRSFVDVHLAKSRRLSQTLGARFPHIFTTSYLTHAPLEEALAAAQAPVPLHLSPGRSVGLRMIPTVRDLHFAWEETPQQILDIQKQKVRDSLRASLADWARAAGEASDYTDNLPLQCMHPTGHWFEISNLLRNGLLRSLLADWPNLRYMMLHNIDTLGALPDPASLGWFIDSGAALAFEVIPREVEDRGGGLARVDGRLRLVEGLAMPDEQIEFDLTWYNSATCWVDIEKLLGLFGLSREDLANDAKVAAAVRALAARLPTYITLKDVKKRWGKGQEDIFPVTQWEKLWGDMTALPEVDCRFLIVDRLRGQQLKDVAQLDGWWRDGSAAYVDSLCQWE
jgi:hypothetical protein